MNALGVLTVMSLLAPAPGPASPFSIHEDVDEGNSTTTAMAPTAIAATAAAAAASSETAAISSSDTPHLIRLTEPSSDPSETHKSPLTFTASPELGPIHDESDHTGRHILSHSVLQHGPSPLAATEHEPSENLDTDVYSSPGSLTAMAGASALRSRRPLLSPVRTAGLSAYASTPIKFEGESEHVADDVHGHLDDTVITALRGHYTMNTESPYNPHISLVAHHLNHDTGPTASSATSSSASGSIGSSDTGSDHDEHHIYPTLGAFPYESAKPIGHGGHTETVSISHKPAHKPKDLHPKKGWSKHWKTALRMLAGLAPLALLLAALPPNVLIVNPTQTSVPHPHNGYGYGYTRGRIADIDEALTDIASCHRVCEQLRAALSAVRLGGRESWPGFADLVEAAKSPSCAESLCAPDSATGTTTTTTTTTVTTRTASSTPHPGAAAAATEDDIQPENKKHLIKKNVKVMKRRKNSHVTAV